MPEWKKKKLEDADEEEEHSIIAEEEGIVQVPMEGHLKCDPATVNITDEMSKGSFGNVWKNVDPSETTKKEPSAKSSPS